jgi:hypothetical protein
MDNIFASLMTIEKVQSYIDVIQNALGTSCEFEQAFIIAALETMATAKRGTVDVRVQEAATEARKIIEEHCEVRTFKKPATKR